ncbi:Uncharacterised protein [Candidatus Tiddalikarchaeum anstoanum]|nr:Uncharacterised protein [Candidatus Tiddalikarchaeum anstoanum]
MGFCVCVVDSFEGGNLDSYNLVYNSKGTVDSSFPRIGVYGLNQDMVSSINRSSSGCNVYTVWVKLDYSLGDSGGLLYIQSGGVSRFGILMGYDVNEGFRYYNAGVGWGDIGSSAGLYPTVDTWYKMNISYVDTSTSITFTVQDKYDNILYATTLTGVTPYTIGAIALRNARTSHHVYWDDVGDPVADEAAGSAAIEEGIHSSILGSNIATYPNQKVYIRYKTGDQNMNSFDRVVKTNNQLWAFNYVTTGENYSNMNDITSAVYIWEGENRTPTNITNTVSNLINQTKI